MKEVLIPINHQIPLTHSCQCLYDTNCPPNSICNNCQTAPDQCIPYQCCQSCREIKTKNLFSRYFDDSNSYLSNQIQGDSEVSLQQSHPTHNDPEVSLQSLTSQMQPETTTINRRIGCCCKKIKCANKQCKCHRNGMHCTKLCECIDCLNTLQSKTAEHFNIGNYFNLASVFQSKEKIPEERFKVKEKVEQRKEECLQDFGDEVFDAPNFFERASG